MFFLIGGFGGAQRRYAAIKFLLYSLTSGLVMLAAVIGVYVNSQSNGHGTFLLSDLMNMNLGTNTERLLFVGFMIAFAVKAPMVPVHTWLPDARATTPGGGSDDGRHHGQDWHLPGMLPLCAGSLPERS
ncbi:MAG: proton-conducting transporter membrane subunit [Lawsonella clevelandensis]